MIDPVKVVLEMLKRRGVTTDLENDIIDTAEKLHKQPFSREDAQKKIFENDIKHPDIAITISNIPGTVRKRFCEFSEDELAWIDEIAAKVRSNFVHYRHRPIKSL